jgi:hypothetical protein
LDPLILKTGYSNFVETDDSQGQRQAMTRCGG